MVDDKPINVNDLFLSEVKRQQAKSTHKLSDKHKNVPDITVVGNGDSFRLLFQTSSEFEGWQKSTIKGGTKPTKSNDGNISEKSVLKKFIKDNLLLVVEDNREEENNSVNIGLKFVGDKNCFCTDSIYIPDDDINI